MSKRICLFMPGWDCHSRIGRIVESSYPDWIDKIIDEPEEQLDSVPDEGLKNELKKLFEEYKKESKDIYDWICRKRLFNNLPENIRCLAVLHCIIDEFYQELANPKNADKSAEDIYFEVIKKYEQYMQKECLEEIKKEMIKIFDCISDCVKQRIKELNRKVIDVTRGNGERMFHDRAVEYINLLKDFIWEVRRWDKIKGEFGLWPK